MAEAMSSEALAVRAEFETWDGAPGPKRHFAAAFVDVDALCAHVVELRKRPVATPETVEFMDAARAFVHAQRRSGFGTNAMMPYWHRLEAAERATDHQPRILGLPVVLDPTIPLSKIILRSGESEVHAGVFAIDAARAAGGGHRV